jgi:hypothetical protein
MGPAVRATGSWRRAVRRWASATSILCGFGQKKTIGGALDKGEENRRGWRGSGSLVLAESRNSGDEVCRLRREISAAWRRAEQGKGGGKAEGVTGYL